MKNPIGVQSSKPDRIDIAMMDGRWRCRRPSLRFYFFFAAAPEVAGLAAAQVVPSVGEGSFLGCLGFFVSRLPRN
ncbi:hypothetical protein [Burkholderia sp. L27(2015)]|uniref:hypothetical protein n=1 Tax=Burkholderia sp. L27(2015) TaxID=1641858 RepID=UPI00131CB908|nr:hypothetical protein [Burkholderia sp. L27(2015)]